MKIKTRQHLKLKATLQDFMVTLKQETIKAITPQYFTVGS